MTLDMNLDYSAPTAEVATHPTTLLASEAVDYDATSSELLRDWNVRGGTEGQWLTSGQPSSDLTNGLDPSALTESLFYINGCRISLRADGAILVEQLQDITEYEMDEDEMSADEVNEDEVNEDEVNEDEVNEDEVNEDEVHELGWNEDGMKENEVDEEEMNEIEDLQTEEQGVEEEGRSEHVEEASDLRADQDTTANNTPVNNGGDDDEKASMCRRISTGYVPDAGEVDEDDSGDEYKEDEERDRREERQDSSMDQFYYDNADLDDPDDEMPTPMWTHLAGKKRKTRGEPPKRALMIQEALYDLHYPQKRRKVAAKGAKTKTKSGRNLKPTKKSK